MWWIGFRPPPPKQNKKVNKPHPYSKSEYGFAFLARAFTVRKNHLLSVLLHKRLLKLGSISSAWALLCLCSPDWLMQCSCRVDLSWSLIPSNFADCVFNDVRWSPMPLFASSLVSHQRSSPLAAHFLESCPFLFVFSFSNTGSAFPFSPHCFFLLEVDCCLSRTAAATCCKTNSLEYGWKFLIAKARLLTLTWTWKWEKKMKVADDRCLLVSYFNCKVWPAWLYFGEIWTRKLGTWTC